MKNPLLDAIRNMKAKRVAIVVGDADEMGLPNMTENGLDSGEGLAARPGRDQVAESQSMDNQLNEDTDLQGEAGDYADADDDGSDDTEPDEDDQAASSSANPPPSQQTEAEQVLGRKPFSGRKPASVAQDSGDGVMAKGEIPESIARELIDDKALERMRSSGRKPNGLFQRAQAGLADRMKRNKR